MRATAVDSLVELEYALDARFQVRNKMDERVVEEYAKAMSVGTKFPPIRLARIKGVLFLIDGFHRDAASRIAGCTPEATIEEMTEREALQAVALANLTHGVRLKPSERINAFKAYIKGKGHIKKDGKLKSYREIALDLHGLGGHTTIRNWMFKHFKKIAAQIGGETHGNGNAEAPRIDPEVERAKQAREAIENAAQLLPAIRDPERLHELQQQVAELLETFKGRTMIKPDF